jgi:hypothetical protein
MGIYTSMYGMVSIHIFLFKFAIKSCPPLAGVWGWLSRKREALLFSSPRKGIIYRTPPFDKGRSGGIY